MQNGVYQTGFKILATTVVLMSVIFTGGCATSTTSALAEPVDTSHSPKPIYMPLRAAWDQALKDASHLNGGDVVVGSGDSMAPLYRHRTVLVIEAQDYHALKAGMTVVFFGDQGFPIAHTLVEKTKTGWTAAGVGNSHLDRNRVTTRNYVGTAVKDYSPTSDSIRGLATSDNAMKVASLMNMSSRTTVIQ